MFLHLASVKLVLKKGFIFFMHDEWSFNFVPVLEGKNEKKSPLRAHKFE